MIYSWLPVKYCLLTFVSGNDAMQLLKFLLSENDSFLYKMIKFIFISRNGRNMKQAYEYDMKQAKNMAQNIGICFSVGN